MRDKEVNNPWQWKGHAVREEDIPDWAHSFIYHISHFYKDENGYLQEKFYIGKKQLTSTRKTKIGKRAIAAEKLSRSDGKAHTIKKVTKASDWMNYWGSSAEVKAARSSGIGEWERTIVGWCFSKKNATYMELKMLIEMNVLERNDSYNLNLLGSIYKCDTDKKLYDEFLERKRKKV